MASARRQGGTAAVEFALLLTLLVPVAFGGTEFGRVFYQYNTLLKATRQAARAMSLAAGSANEATARCLAVHGTPTCTSADPALLNGLSEANVFFVYDNVSNGVASVPVVRVEIRNFQFTSVVPWVVPNITLAALGTSMRQVAP